MAGADTAGGQTAASPFWTFSLRIYGRPGVPAACLTLQDQSGAPVDVNVLLFALFCAQSGRVLDVDALRRISGLVEAWRADVVVPLRQARRALKQPVAAFDTPATAALRQKVKAVELEAERLQQEALFAALPVHELGASGEPATAAPTNVAAYAQALGAQFDPAAVAVLTGALTSLKD